MHNFESPAPRPPARPLVGRLPRMDDPLGKHWRQPKGLRDRVEVFETHVRMTAADFYALPNYYSTTPSGVYPGKVWRQGWKWVCWWGPERNKRCRCVCIRVLLV